MSDKAEEIRQFLLTSRATLLGCLNGLTEEQWQAPVFSEDNQWTVTDILRHLADAQRGMTGQIAQIQAGGTGVPEDFDLNRWNARGVRKAQEKTAPDLLADLEQGQAQVLTLLTTIQADDWDKKGRHGSGRILSIAEIFQVIGGHEVTHANDIRQALNLA